VLGLHPLWLDYLVGAPKHDPLKNRERDNASALIGRHFTIKINNQLIFGGSDRGNDRGRVGGAGCVGDAVPLFLGRKTQQQKTTKI
jgi:hypothetical protein